MLRSDQYMFSCLIKSWLLIGLVLTNVRPRIFFKTQTKQESKQASNKAMYGGSALPKNKDNLAELGHHLKTSYSVNTC